MKLVEVIVEEHSIKKVKYICSVEDDDFKNNSDFGIAEMESGDMSNSGGDAMGMTLETINKFILETNGYESEILSWKPVNPEQLTKGQE